jgi:hypothetical protein
MSNYAKVLNGKVIEVIVADEDFFKTFVDTSPGAWLKTSYNTYGNKHANGGTPLRGNYAGIGFTYDDKNDVFYAPQPFASWSLNANWLWQPPVKMPTDGKFYVWDESSKTWVEQNG